MEANQEKIPPQNLDAEMSVLGSMLIDSEAISKAIEGISGNSFYKTAHRKIFESILKLYEESQPVDIVTLTDRLLSSNELESVGGAAYIASLINTVPTSANVDHYLRIVKEKAMSRSLIRACTDILGTCYAGTEDINQLLDLAEKRVFDITQARGERGFVSIKDLIRDSIEAVESLYQRKEHVTGLATGFKELDAITCGSQPSDLPILAARPSMGKTALALNIAEHVGVEMGKAVALFSLEMSRSQLVLRMLCSHANVNVKNARTGFLSEKRDFPRLISAAGKLAAARIFIDDTPALSALEMRAKARRLKAKENVDLIVLDYLQLMRTMGRAESRQQEISEISRGLKALARELDVPVLVLSQLNRDVENRPGNKPRLADLRESGAIEQDADVVMLLVRPEYYDPEKRPGEADVIIAKQRNGPTGERTLMFHKEFTRFYDLSEREGVPPEEEEEMPDF